MMKVLRLNPYREHAKQLFRADKQPDQHHYSIRNNYRKESREAEKHALLWGKLALLSWHTNESVKITGSAGSS